MNFCPKCGTKLNDGICGKCGFTATSSKQPVNPVATKIRVDQLKASVKNLNRKNKMIIASVIALLVIFGAILPSFRTLSNTLPGNAFYSPQLRSYLVFGTGKYKEQFILVNFGAKRYALNALKNEDEFGRVFRGYNEGNDTTAGKADEHYDISGKNLGLHYSNYYQVKGDNFSDDNSVNVSTGLVGALITDIAIPAIKNGIDEATTKMQKQDYSYSYTLDKITGFGKHHKVFLKTQQGKIIELDQISE